MIIDQIERLTVDRIIVEAEEKGVADPALPRILEGVPSSELSKFLDNLQRLPPAPRKK